MQHTSGLEYAFAGNLTCESRSAPTAGLKDVDRKEGRGGRDG
jgi:hypothetical protein